MEKCKINLMEYFLSGSLMLISLILFTYSIDLFAASKHYPGKLINIGTHRLHLNCTGDGSPTVIIDSGIGGFSLEWADIQNKLADNVRICSYDRAGYGFSETGPSPRTTNKIASELRRLLEVAKIPGPYILVGHSFGGYNVRYFASKYPQLTAGLVLIDASHPEQFKTEEFKRKIPLEQIRQRNFKNKRSVRMMQPVISQNFPSKYRTLAFRLMSTMKSKRTYVNEMDYMEISADQVSELTNHPPYSFPVKILTRGKRVFPHNDMGERREQQWTRLQNDLQHISLNSYHHLAEESGHIIHLDQPAFVSNHILATVSEVRSIRKEFETIRKFDIRMPNLAVNYSFQESEQEPVLLRNFLSMKNYSIFKEPMAPFTIGHTHQSFYNRSIYKPR